MRMGVVAGLAPDALQECGNHTGEPAETTGPLAPDGTPYCWTSAKKIGSVSGVSTLSLYADDGKRIGREHYPGVTLRRIDTGTGPKE